MVYVRPRYEWPLTIILLVGCFGQVYDRERALDEMAPATTWQVMMTYLAVLNGLFGLWQEAFIALVCGVAPILSTAIIIPVVVGIQLSEILRR